MHARKRHIKYTQPPCMCMHNDIHAPAFAIVMLGQAGQSTKVSLFLCYTCVPPPSPPLQASPSPISSCLVEERRGMKRAMLEVVAAGVVATSGDVERYLKCR